MRHRLAPRTLRARLTLLAALAVLGVLTLVGAGLVLAQREALVDSVEEAMEAQVGVVAARLAGGDPIGPDDVISEDLSVEVRSPQGEVLVAVVGDAGPLPPMPPQDSGGEGTADLDDGPARLLIERVDGAVVRVAGSLEEVEEATGTLVGALGVAVPASTAVLAAVVWWVVGRALRPVERIRDRVDSIGGTALDRRVPEPAGPEEVARLARTMNAMLARLQAAADQQRRFVADASHELRTPLARMRAEMEVDVAHPESADATATAASVLAEVASLQQLVDDLLLLAQADAGALASGRVPVDLDEVVAGPVLRARAAGARIDTSGVRPVQVRGDPAQLERLVANLVGNAVRHAGDRVDVALDEDDGAAVLTVADDGPGIASADAERVFERFTRLDEARSKADGGAGLGLAIARDIAVRHGGTLVVDPAPRGGARFVLTLPADRSGL